MIWGRMRSGPLRQLRRLGRLLSGLGSLRFLLRSGSSLPKSSPELSELEVGFLLESIKLLGGDGVLVLGQSGRSRLDGLEDNFERIARAERVPASLLKAIAWGESSFKVDAVGPPIGDTGKRAFGLMQIAEFNFGSLISEGVWRTSDDWRSPERNIAAGVWDLKRKGLGTTSIEQVLKRFGGFVTVDHRPYVNKVLSRATFLALDSLRKGRLT